MELNVNYNNLETIHNNLKLLNCNNNNYSNNNYNKVIFLTKAGFFNLSQFFVELGNEIEIRNFMREVS